MQGSIAQLLSLAITGNAYLQGRPLGRFWPDSTVFRYCREVVFATPAAGDSESPVILATDPMRWLESLEGQTAGLKVHVIGQRTPADAWWTVGFVGGGSRWILESVAQRGKPDHWQEDWQFADRRGSDDRIWSVVYWKLDGTPTALSADRPLPKIAAELSTALEEIAGFSGAHGLRFEEQFRAARDALFDGGPFPYHPDIAPIDFLDAEAQNMLTACMTGWVFGGMGSWNDVVIDRNLEEEYRRLSGTLFELIQEGLAAAANSSFRAPQR